MTCELDSSTPGQTANTEPYWQQLQEMADRDAPTIWVVKCVGSRPDHECVVGEGMAKALFAAGCVALVTDGGVRDVSGLLTVPFAAYCNGKTIHHGPLHFSSPGKPVQLGGIAIQTGDVIHANGEGVVRIPAQCLEQIISRSIQMRACEQEVHCIWRRTDLVIESKRRAATELFAKYGFGIETKHELK